MSKVLSLVLYDIQRMRLQCFSQNSRLLWTPSTDTCTTLVDTSHSDRLGAVRKSHGLLWQVVLGASQGGPFSALSLHKEKGQLVGVEGASVLRQRYPQVHVSTTSLPMHLKFFPGNINKISPFTTFILLFCFCRYEMLVLSFGLEAALQASQYSSLNADIINDLSHVKTQTFLCTHQPVC